MDREIKFRAIHNGKWVYGYVQFRTKTYDAVMWLENEDGLFDWVHVDKNTVGQYIGKLDRNGIEVYDGDILSRSFMDGHENQKGVIRYIEGSPCIVAGGKFRPITDGFGWMGINEYYDRKGMDVIGNIYENPELLPLAK